jgi:hypothetical protein
LSTIAMCQARWDPNARGYLARKRTEGKRPAEAHWCLKRHAQLGAAAADDLGHVHGTLAALKSPGPAGG